MNSPSDSDNVVRPSFAKHSGKNGGGNGNGLDGRLRALEIQGTRIDERILAMQENMAKKNDVTGLKVWILGGVLSAIVIGAGMAAMVVKAFLSST